MNSFLLAVQFLTILPLEIKTFKPEKLAWSLIFFPWVGLFLGLALAGLNILLTSLGILPLAINIILVISLIIFTGGMHLDGLSDTSDAFFSGKDKKEMLEIMRDSRIGVMGALSLISIILLKIAFLLSVDPVLKPMVLILMCTLGRWSSVLAIYLFPYARQEGKVKLFKEGMNLKIFIIALTSVIICVTALFNIPGLVLLLIVSGFIYLTGKFICKKIEGITGDALGATVELTELVTLLIVCVAQGMING